MQVIKHQKYRYSHGILPSVILKRTAGIHDVTGILPYCRDTRHPSLLQGYTVSFLTVGIHGILPYCRGTRYPFLYCSLQGYTVSFLFIGIHGILPYCRDTRYPSLLQGYTLHGILSKSYFKFKEYMVSNRDKEQQCHAFFGGFMKSH